MHVDIYGLLHGKLDDMMGSPEQERLPPHTMFVIRQMTNRSISFMDKTQLVKISCDDLASGSADHDALTRRLVAKASTDHQQERTAALRQEWNQFLSEGLTLARSLVPDEEVLLREQSRKLYEAWSRFCKSLPDEQRERASKQIPSIKLLHDSVAEASESWKERRGDSRCGRAKRIFTRLCDTFQSHKKLVSILPTDNTYVTLLTGSLTAIAQASINHQELAEGVSSTLDDLSDDMAYWNELISEYPDSKILHRYIRDLYVVVFEFLTEIFTEWSRSSWKRFVTSFDEKSFEKIFTERRDRIKAIERRMKRNVELDFERSTTRSLKLYDERQMQMALDLHEMKRGLTHLNEVFRQLGESAFHQLSEGSDPYGLDTQYRPRVEHRQAGLLIDSNLLEIIHLSNEFKDKHPPGAPVETLARGIESQETAGDSDCLPQGQPFNKQKILSLLASITKRYSRDIRLVVDTVTQASNAHISDSVARRTEAWTMNSQSDKLWIQSPHDTEHPSNATFTAVSLVALANNSKLPCLSYFCSFGVHGTAASQNMTCQDMLTDMVRSLIVQLVLLLPDDLRAPPSLSLSRFEELNKPRVDMDKAMQLFRDLRSLAPPYLHCVIDAAQELEDRDDLLHTQTLYRVLRTILDVPDRSGDVPQTRENIVKLCILSDGHVDVLAVLAERGHIDKMEVDDSMTEESPGLISRWQWIFSE